MLIKVQIQIRYNLHVKYEMSIMQYWIKKKAGILCLSIRKNGIQVHIYFQIKIWSGYMCY